jgi:hypothetical protein
MSVLEYNKADLCIKYTCSVNVFENMLPLERVKSNGSFGGYQGSKAHSVIS